MKSPFILIKESFAQYFSNIALYGGIYLLPTIGSYLLVFNVEDGQELALGTSVAFAVVSVILMVLNVYAAIALVKAVNDPTMTIMASFKQSYGFFWKYVLLSLLLGFMTLLGLLLLVVPGIMIMIYTSLAYIVLVLEDKGPIASCKQSYHYIKGQWWAVAWRLLVFVGFSFVYAFAFSLASRLAPGGVWIGRRVNVGRGLVLGVNPCSLWNRAPGRIPISALITLLRRLLKILAPLLPELLPLVRRHAAHFLAILLPLRAELPAFFR